MLTIPFAVNNCGLLMGLLFIFVFSIIAGFTTQWLVECKVNSDDGSSTYPQFTAKLFGKKLGEYIASICIILLHFGPLVGKKKKKKK